MPYNSSRVYVLFSNSESPRSYFRMEPSTKEKNIIGYFTLYKIPGDCPFNTFTFSKYSTEKSIIRIKMDTLQDVITSKWVATQPDSVLIRLFRHKNIYVIPKDSLKNNEGNAYLTTYSYCEDI